MQVKPGYYLKGLGKGVQHNKPTLGSEEKEAAARVFNSGWLAQGGEVAAFEDEICCFLGLPVGHAVALSSGTAALFMALWALGAQGKAVAFPVYACSALRNAVVMVGGSEIMLDTAPGSPNLAPEDIVGSQAEIAIVPHMFGFPVDLSHIGGVNIVEDCAQAIGASVSGVPAGLQGKVGIYSFYATKLLTSGGQGGMLVSRDKALVDDVRDYRDFDFRHDRKPRFNFQMTDLQAAVGRVQLHKLPYFLVRRSELFERYRQAGIALLDNYGTAVPVRYRAIMKTDRPRQIINVLGSRGIKSIVPVEDWELLGNGDDFPNSLRLSRGTLSLPLYPSLMDRDVEMIIDGVVAA
jgi:perosamine synthetase